MIEWSYTLEGAAASAADASAPPVPATFALDPATGDLAVPLVVLRGPAAVVQRIRCRFRFWLGEWFLDTRKGIPYRERVLIKNPDTNLISALFREVLESTPGVRAVEYFRAELDKPSRTLTCAFQCYLDDGARVLAVGEPFQVTS